VGNSLRILFVGGCHINGFPVGEKYSFTHVALRSLLHVGDASLNVLPLFNLHSGAQILAACRELKPDAIVLQLGHYEAPKALKKTLGLGTKKKDGVKRTTEISQPQPEMRYRPSFFTTPIELRRIAAAAIIIALGKKRRMFDPKAIADSLDSILLSLKDLPLRGIVLVGPFSAPDPLTRFCRRKVVPIFEAAAKKYGSTFVDVFSFLESFPRGKAFRANFADYDHLSVLGHQRVGALVGAALANMLEPSTATAVERLKAKSIEEDRPPARPGWAGQPAVARRSQSVGAA
jgi:hypothetical protein